MFLIPKLKIVNMPQMIRIGYHLRKNKAIARRTFRIFEETKMIQT